MKRVWLSGVMFLGAVGSLIADEVHLNTGGSIEGVVREDDGQHVSVETVTGTVTVPADIVKSIDREHTSTVERFYERLELVEQNPTSLGFLELADWAKSLKLKRFESDARARASVLMAREEKAKLDLAREEYRIRLKDLKDRNADADEFSELARWAGRNGLEDLSAGLRSEVQTMHRSDFNRQLALLKSEGSADDLYKLSEWARDRALPAERRQALLAALRNDAEHEWVRRALGYERHEGEWLTHDEAMQAQGYVRYKGKWMTPAEQELQVDADRADLEARIRKVEREERDLERKEADLARAQDRIEDERRAHEATMKRERERLEGLEDQIADLEDRIRDREFKVAQRERDVASREEDIKKRERWCHDHEQYYNRVFGNHRNVTYCNTHRVWWSRTHHRGCPYCDHMGHCK